MMNVNTDLLVRLRAKDEHAWFELWDVFGPSIERMVASIARQYFGQETMRDIGQETLSRLYQEIGKFDRTRGVKFSAWLYGIARHVVLTEITRRSALKRRAGTYAQSLDALEGMEPAAQEAPYDIEVSIFRAKVLRAVRNVEARTEHLEFEAFRLKLLQGMQGKDIAEHLGISEPTVSRYLRKVREDLRREIATAVAAYSWTPTEEAQVEGTGLDRADADDFDRALESILIAAEDERRRGGELQETARKAVPAA